MTHRVRNDESVPSGSAKVLDGSGLDVFVHHPANRVRPRPLGHYHVGQIHLHRGLVRRRRGAQVEEVSGIRARNTSLSPGAGNWQGVERGVLELGGHLGPRRAVPSRVNGGHGHFARIGGCHVTILGQEGGGVSWSQVGVGFVNEISLLHT